jgi:hypothetical protein
MSLQFTTLPHFLLSEGWKIPTLLPDQIENHTIKYHKWKKREKMFSINYLAAKNK